MFRFHCVGSLRIIKQRRIKLSGLFLVSCEKVTLTEITGCRDERGRHKPTLTTNPHQPNRKQFLILRLLDNILPIYSLVCLLVRGCCRARRHRSLRYSDAVLGHVCNLSLQISGKKALTEAMPALERRAGRTSVQLSTLK